MKNSQHLKQMVLGTWYLARSTCITHRFTQSNLVDASSVKKIVKLSCKGTLNKINRISIVWGFWILILRVMENPMNRFTWIPNTFRYSAIPLVFFPSWIILLNAHFIFYTYKKYIFLLHIFRIFMTTAYIHVEK